MAPCANDGGWKLVRVGDAEWAVSAAQNQDGRLAAFVEGGDGGLWTIEQTAPGLWQ